LFGDFETIGKVGPDSEREKRLRQCPKYVLSLVGLGAGGKAGGVRLSCAGILAGYG